MMPTIGGCATSTLWPSSTGVLGARARGQSEKCHKALDFGAQTCHTMCIPNKGNDMETLDLQTLELLAALEADLDADLDFDADDDLDEVA